MTTHHLPRLSVGSLALFVIYRTTSGYSQRENLAYLLEKYNGKVDRS